MTTKNDYKSLIEAQFRFANRTLSHNDYKELLMEAHLYIHRQLSDLGEPTDNTGPQVSEEQM